MGKLIDQERREVVTREMVTITIHTAYWWCDGPGCGAATIKGDEKHSYTAYGRPDGWTVVEESKLVPIPPGQRYLKADPCKVEIETRAFCHPGCLDAWVRANPAAEAMQVGTGFDA